MRYQHDLGPSRRRGIPTLPLDVELEDGICRALTLWLHHSSQVTQSRSSWPYPLLSVKYHMNVSNYTCAFDGSTFVVITSPRQEAFQVPCDNLMHHCPGRHSYGYASIIRRAYYQQSHPLHATDVPVFHPCKIGHWTAFFPAAIC